MLLSIISVIANIVYFIVLNIDLYTDRATMPDGNRHVWHRSAIDRLDAADNRILLYLFLFVAAVNIISAILFFFGIKNNVVRIIRLASLIVSSLLFVIILIYSGGVHPTY
ncbi:MAG: hypothetical protein K5697_10310 [Lachnospiraceae bacterium]|nr:hypothetical protein [Lachnospiraceae bacterium]